jgi:hypothetical protein
MYAVESFGLYGIFFRGGDEEMMRGGTINL